MRAVTFIDTSVLCNIIPIPGRAQYAQDVKTEMVARMRNEDFILPITAVIEAGNFIAQLNDGRLRRETAEKLARILQLVCDGRSPWILHDFPWDGRFLAKLLEGADTGVDYVALAQQGVGAGDLCILTERQLFQERTHIEAKVWSLDRRLGAYGPAE